MCVQDPSLGDHESQIDIAKTPTKNKKLSAVGGWWVGRQKFLK